MLCGVVFAVGGLCVPASAARYYYCYLSDMDLKRGYFVTPVLQAEVDSIDESKTGSAFYEFMSSRLPQGSVKYGCSDWSSQAKAQEYLDYFMRKTPGASSVDWPNPPVPSRKVDSVAAGSRSGAGQDQALIEISGAEEEAARQRALEQARLENQARWVKEKAAGMVQARQQDAESKAAIARALEALKRQGRKQ